MGAGGIGIFSYGLAICTISCTMQYHLRHSASAMLLIHNDLHLWHATCTVGRPRTATSTVRQSALDRQLDDTRFQTQEAANAGLPTDKVSEDASGITATE